MKYYLIATLIIAFTAHAQEKNNSDIAGLTQLCQEARDKILGHWENNAALSLGIYKTFETQTKQNHENQMKIIDGQLSKLSASDTKAISSHIDAISRSKEMEKRNWSDKPIIKSESEENETTKPKDIAEEVNKQILDIGSREVKNVFKRMSIPRKFEEKDIQKEINTNYTSTGIPYIEVCSAFKDEETETVLGGCTFRVLEKNKDGIFKLRAVKEGELPNDEHITGHSGFDYFKSVNGISVDLLIKASKSDYLKEQELSMCEKILDSPDRYLIKDSESRESGKKPKTPAAKKQ